MSAYWVKITTDIWGNDKIKLIDAMPDRDSILIIWFKLITQAGLCNAEGRVQFNDIIPLDADMLSTIFNRPQEIIEKAFSVFQRFGMIEIDSEGFIDLPNWYKYQAVDALEKLMNEDEQRKAANRERVAKSRAKAKAKALEKCNVTVTQHVMDIREEKELEKESELDPKKPIARQEPDEPELDPIPYRNIIDYLNAVTKQSFRHAEGHYKWIRARWNEGHRLEDFKHVIDVKNAEWGKEPRPGQKDYRQYLRPETLFGTKFDGYRNQKMPKGAGTNGRNAASEDDSRFVD